MPKKKENTSVEEVFKQLDEIIEGLESEDISLEASFKLYTRGMELISTANSRIDEVEKQVLMLNDSGDVVPFEEELP